MRFSRWGLTVILSANLWASSASANAFDPTAYIPANASMVAVIRSPATTIKRMNTLGRAAGLIPNGAQGNVVLQQIQTLLPGLEEHIDLTQPIWATLLTADLQNLENAPMLIMAKSKGKGKLSVPPQSELNITHQHGWLLASTPNAPKPTVHKHHFMTPSTASEITARGDIILYAHTQDVGGMEKFDATGAAIGKLFEDFFESDSITSLSIAEGGLELLSQSQFNSKEHRKLIAEQAQAQRKKPPQPLLRGLPSSDYLVLLGSYADSSVVSKYLQYIKKELTRRWPIIADILVEEMKAEDTDNGKPLSAQEKAVRQQTAVKLTEIAKTTISTLLDSLAEMCPRSTIGLRVNVDKQSLSSESVNWECKNTNALPQSLKSLAGRLNTSLSELSALLNTPRPGTSSPPEKPIDLRLSLTKTSSKRHQLQLVSTTTEIPPQLRQPVVFSAINDHQASMSFGISSEQQAALEAAAVKNAPLEMHPPKILLNNRSVEGYLQPWATLASLLPRELLMLSPIIRLLPPIAFSTRNELDGSVIAQLWIPEKVIHVGVAAGGTAAALNQ